MPGRVYEFTEMKIDVACQDGCENYDEKLVGADVVFLQLYSYEQYGQLFYICCIWVSHQLYDGYG
jgi:hypothetical protein